MATEVKIPVPDQTTEEVRIVKWKKSLGEAVEAGEVVLEVETDKSIIEIDAVAGGVLLKQLFMEDDMVPVGKTVGMIGPAGSEIETAGVGKTVSAGAAPGTAPTVRPTEPSTGHVKVSPIAEKVAAKLGVDSGLIRGSGPGGKIIRKDVEQFAAGKQTVPASTTAMAAGGRIPASPNAKRLARELDVDLYEVAGSGPDGRILGTDVEKYAFTAPERLPKTAPTATSVPVAGQAQVGSVVKLSKMRRAIGLNLQMSFRDTPHFNVTMSIDMTNAMQLRSRLNEGKDKSQCVSVNDLVVKACAHALKQYPVVNSRFEEDRINYLADINIGVATAVEAGLVVPVLTNADKRDWYDLAMETKRLAQEARNGKIIGAGKGTFTVSNLGMFGVDEFTAIINPPESAILAVGAIKNTVVDIGGGIGVRPMMKVTLCSDHRIIDGTIAAQFLQCVKEYLEQQVA